ncbi:DUF1876 domain-containing protein [Phytohabitans suffuscus]|uniref:DUF1876 domain-containing protein n=1 Tax=Phytohabitans suffuscus TaxID=624315 RepID=A0A6F8YTT2_9ACTN|nr:DUF1876 domain-containing protein [Phytohabitans suffuscus]BCB89560.1 hypothetical protein Psuf_068730 [Phytohabitans suffuscus]
MTRAKQWTVEVFVDEHEDERRTRAEARLHTPNWRGLVGVGEARRNPADPEVPEIGDELAVSRALSDLAHRLLDAAAGDIEQIAGDIEQIDGGAADPPSRAGRH